MKTFQYHFDSEEDFTARVQDLAASMQGAEHGPVLFHVFAECWCEGEVRAIRRIVREAIPDALLVGTASFGNIQDGHYTRNDIVVVVQVCERADTRIEVHSCSLAPAAADDSLAAFLNVARARPWVKAVEAFIMADVPMVTHCCAVLSDLPEGVDFFGGKSRFDHAPEAPKFVIGDDGECAQSTAVFVLYGGEDLHVQTGLIQGWIPLGRAMKVTRFENDILNELDGQPAFDLYYKYLRINNDENYFFNTLEFPILFFTGDESVLRISHACLDDGSMVLGATIPECDYARIAFGDSNEILRSVLSGGRRFEEFRPDSIVMYSCACRRTFWGDEESNSETLPFQALAPTCGYYTAGELLRQNGVIAEHNSTMVVAALREGEAADKPAVEFGMSEADLVQSDSTNSRLSNFIAAAIDELEQANRELERLSITDGLTGLLNRRETERVIRDALAGERSAGDVLFLVMMDIDDFKAVNDTYGHGEGDLVLCEFSRILRELAEAAEPEVHVGRWGGEEFMAVVRGADESAVRSFAENLCQALGAHVFAESGSHTASIGVAHAGPTTTADEAMTRADEALYAAKHRGKNCVVVLA